MSSFGWRSIFWINVPCGCIALWLTHRYIHEFGETHKRKWDIIGQLAGTIALAAIIFVLIEGKAGTWRSSTVLIALLMALVSSLTFILAERRHASPMIELSFFRVRTFSAANIASGLMNFGIFGMLFVLSLYLLRDRGLSASAAGTRLLAMFIPFAFNLPIGGHIAGRFGNRIPAAFGLGISGFSLLTLVHFRGNDIILVCSLVFIGFGLAVATPALVSAALGSLPPDRSSIASAINNTCRQASGAIGIAFIGGFAGKSTSIAIVASGAALIGGALIAAVFVEPPSPV